MFVFEKGIAVAMSHVHSWLTH